MQEKVNIPTHTVIKYLRVGGNGANKRKPLGVLVAVKLPNGEISVNYSYCNRKDRFVKKTALNLAIERAKAEEVCDTTPYKVVKEIESFSKRIERYYKKSAKPPYLRVKPSTVEDGPQKEPVFGLNIDLI